MLNRCTGRQRADPDAGWHAKEKEMRCNPLYKLLDIRMGGQMVEVFEEEGADGIRRFCVENLESQYLNNSGDGEIITHATYGRWRHHLEHKDKEYDGGYVEGSKDYKQDRFIRFEEHIACSKLENRGVRGETILHLCYHNDTPVHTEIAKVLLQLYPKLALDIIEGEECYGQSALHLAIVNGDLDSVKLLVENGANVNQAATGRFFLPEDQKIKRKRTNFVGYAYYGEYPLSFAACFGHESIYDYLLRHGADPNLQDSNGNTVLHMVIINNQLDMYSYAVRHHIKPANTWIKNGPAGSKHGLTPLALASKLGRQHIFNEIMELHRIELWRYSNVGCSLYPLHAVDSIGIGGHTNWNSALMIIVNGETDDHLEMLQGGVIRQLLDEKWKTFVRKQFFQRLLLVFAHLLFLTIAIYLRPDHDLVIYNRPRDGIRYACEIIVVMGCIGNYIMHIEEVKSLGLRLFFVNLKNAPSKALYLISSALVILCLPVRLAHFGMESREAHHEDTEEVHLLQTVEETMLIIAVPCAWCMLLFFAKGHSLTGTSVMMFYKILVGDVVKFLIIYSCFLICFSQAFFFLYKDVRLMSDGSEILDYKTLPGSIMSLIHMTFGDFNFTQFEYTIYPELTMIVFFAFMLLMPILLLNMLIAMMGNTYMNIIAKSEKEWIRQWAKIVMVLERAFSKDSLLKFQDQYSVPIEAPPKAETEHIEEEYGGTEVAYRALMVIKASNKTMAKQRKDAISNWKWMLKETLRLIKELRKAGYSGPIDFKKVFPDENEFMLYENALLRKVPSTNKYTYVMKKLKPALRPLMAALSKGRKWKRSSVGLKKRSSGFFGGGDSDPDWTAAVEQLAWEKDLNLSTNGTFKADDGPAPLDQVDSPPDSRQQVSGPPTESTMVDYMNDDELDAIIQQAENFGRGTPNSKASNSSTRILSNRQSDITNKSIEAILRPPN